MKIAFLCDGYNIKSWQGKLIEQLLKEVSYDTVYLINQSVETDNSTKVSGEKNKFWKLYQKLDAKIYDHNGELNSCDIRDYISSYEVIYLKTDRVRARDYVESCRELGIDVALRLGWRIIDGEILSSFKHGILSLHHGDNRVNRGGPWCFWEIYLKQNLTGVTLQVLNSELDAGIVLERGLVKTDFSSLTKNRLAVIEAGNALLIKHLKILDRSGRLLISDDDRIIYDKPIYKTPDTYTLLGFFFRICGFVIRRKLKSLVFNEHWGIAFKRNTKKSVDLSNVNKIKEMKCSFMADPFIITENGKSYVFYERYCYKKNKGIISVYDMDKNIHQDIIEEHYHLSFPFVFFHIDKYYMIPQSENKQIDLYEAVNFPFEWKFKKSLLSSEEKNFSDTVLVFVDNCWFMFTNEFTRNENSNRFMNIYYANSIFDEFYPHDNNPVKINDSETRNAGKIIFLDGDMLRFSQDCSESYGQSMKVMKINKLTKHEYQEESIDKIKPDFFNDIIGTHTLNFNDEFLVTDYKVRKLKVAVTYENTFS
ncbi:hypothetical protein ACOW85_001313 [Vibrio parahaemolyticus]